LVEETGSKASRSNNGGESNKNSDHHRSDHTPAAAAVKDLADYQRQERQFAKDLAAFESLRASLVQARARVFAEQVAEKEASQIMDDLRKCESLHADLASTRTRLVEWQRGMGLKV
jgi:hypothetical protein